MTLAKALCGGIAGGAMLARPDVAASLRPGMHAATFGGNPVAARAGIATLQMIEEHGLLSRATALAARFRQRLEALAAECDLVREVRVLGLMIGVELLVEAAPVVRECLARRVLVNCTQGNVVRLLPPLTLTDEQADEGCAVLAEVIRGLPRPH
jgi:acetylornithine/succinyldiaminopimelate/putrescine aminotransferase